MSKRPVAALFVTVAALVLLLNFKTPDVTAIAAGTSGLAVVATPAATSATSGTSLAGTTDTTAVSQATATPAASSSSGTSSSGSSSSAAASAGTFTGSVVDTRYGPVQVQVTVSGGTITAVEALQYPSTDPHSSRINATAIPALVQEALQAQSAQVNSVSGATYTSEAFMQSLQSALDAAHA